MTKIDEMKDYELVQAFAKGDQEAARILVQRYYSKVLSICHYYLYAHGESYDAAQEVFLQIMGRKKVLSYRGEVKLWSWLYRVTVNTCYVRLRQRLRQTLRVVSYENWVKHPEDLFASAALDPEDQNILREELDRLIMAVYQLEAKYCAPLVLVCLHGYTYAEAARCLKISPNSLAVRLSRAKKLLVKNMRRQEWSRRVRRTQCESFRPLAWLPDAI